MRRKKKASRLRVGIKSNISNRVEEPQPSPPNPGALWTFSSHYNPKAKEVTKIRNLGEIKRTCCKMQKKW